MFRISSANPNYIKRNNNTQTKKTTDLATERRLSHIESFNRRPVVRDYHEQDRTRGFETSEMGELVQFGTEVFNAPRTAQKIDFPLVGSKDRTFMVFWLGFGMNKRNNMFFLFQTKTSIAF